MLNISNIRFTPPVKLKPKKPTAPVSQVTLNKVTAALKGKGWLSYAEVVKATGLTIGTISRAAKFLAADGVAITKADTVGKSPKSYLKLV